MGSPAANVIVVGSGAAGLSAALAARSVGAHVTLLEATSTIGGSTALSSGAIWAPGDCLRVGHDASIRDNKVLAQTYLDAVSVGDTSAELIAKFVDEAARTVCRLERSTPLALTVLPFPDCHGEFPGGMREGLRSVEPRPFRPPAPIAAMVRPPLPWRPPVTLAEMLAGVSPGLVAERRAAGVLAHGQALVAALLTAAVDAGVIVRTSARATGLHEDGVLVEAAGNGAEEILYGRVVLATGGFERDAALVDAFLRMPIRGVIGAPGARGDGLRMAMSAGAELGNMAEAWWCPTIEVPGDAIEGQPLYRMLFAERSRPGAIMVDRGGRRFADEAQNYCDLGRSLHSFDPAGFRFDRDPAWLLLDAEYRRRYPIGPAVPGDMDPKWLVCAHTLADLARLIDVPAVSLAETVRKFNAGAERGLDPEFGRGTRAFDLVLGDPSAAHPTLRPLTDPPFYAVRVHPGLGGTKGGPRTDAHGRVRHVHGGLIPGLYAAGNAAASPFGLAYPGVGGTIGQALTFGWLAGTSAATD